MLSGTLGHYRIVRLLGRGGMGEVYLAEDTTLGRQVALKILPPELAASGWRERFDREARAVAALNHPNIVTLHSIDEADGTPFLTMEFVDGKMLGELIPADGMPLDRLLKIAIPIADAVGAAHQRGILHRDLKPANVMVTVDGRVKVLDFGLAKLQDAVDTRDALPTQELTGEGRIVGTVAYMSPEQAEGKTIDQRSDVFSLGVLLYELATGQRPFIGDTSLSVLSAILKDAPRPVSELKPELPRDVTRIVRRALNKDPEERYQSAKDLRNDLHSVLEDFASGEVARPPAPAPAATPAPRSSRTAIMGIAAAVAVAALAAGGWWLTRSRREAPSSATPADIWTPVRLTSSGRIRGTGAASSLSPDGRYVAYAQVGEGGQGLWLRQIATSTEVVLRPLERVAFDGMTFSPDGSFIYYSIYPEGDNAATLYRVPTIGGAPQKILYNIDTPVTFSPDARRMAFMSDDPAGRRSVLEVANVDGSGRTRLGEVLRPDRILNNPGRLAWSPDGTTIAAPVLKGPGQSIALFDAATGAMRLISETRWTVAGGVQWLPGGQSLIASYRDGNTATPQLWRVEAGSGAATAITRDLFAYADLSAAADGGMFVATASLGESTLWVAAADNVKQPAQITSGAADAEGAGGVDWMPDGSIVYASRASGNLDLWILDPQTGTRRQLTSDPADDQQPSLSPDGRSIAFVSGREGGNRIWVMHADGTEPRAVSPAPGASPFWTPDGRAILFVSSTEVRQVNTDGTAEKLVGGDWPARAGNAGNLFIPRAISRQGLVAGFVPVSDRGGGWQLAVAPIDRSAPPTVLDATFGSANLGDIAWAPDGKAIDAPQPADAWNLWRYPIDGGKGYRLTAMTGPALTRRFAWSPDGRLLLSRGENKSDLVLFRRASGR